MNKILWEAKYKIKKKSNLYEYEKFLKKKYKIKLNCNFSKIHNWSIKNPERFWSSFWEYSKVKGKKKLKNLNLINKFLKVNFL